MVGEGASRSLCVDCLYMRKPCDGESNMLKEFWCDIEVYQIQLAETFGSRAASTVVLDPKLAKSNSTPSAPIISPIATRNLSRSHSFLFDAVG